MLFSVSYWLISKVEAAKWQQFIREKVTAALAARRRHGARVRRIPRRVSRRRRDRALLSGAVQRRAGGRSADHVRHPRRLAWCSPCIFTLFYRYGVRIPLRPFFAVTSALLYYMAFVFMGKGIRELQEGNVLPITVVPGLPARRCDGDLPERRDATRSVALLVVLFAFALLEDVLAEALGGAADSTRRPCGE